jgi:hypothetical protein
MDLIKYVPKQSPIHVLPSPVLCNINMTGKVYSLEYTKILKVFFMLQTD